MTWGPAIMLAVGLGILAVTWGFLVRLQLAQCRDARRRAARVERQRRETEVEQAIVRRRREGEGTSRAETPDAPAG